MAAEIVRLADTMLVDPVKVAGPSVELESGVGSLGSDPELYRWHWLIKNNRDEDNYAALVEMLQAYGQGSSATYHEAMRRLLDALLPNSIELVVHTDSDGARVGIAKLRINPGNIGSQDHVREVAAACRDRGVTCHTDAAQAVGAGQGVGQAHGVARRDAFGRLQPLQEGRQVEPCQILRHAAVADDARAEHARLVRLHLGVDVRGDDIGSSHAANVACIRCCRDGIVRSLEGMVTAPWMLSKT